MSSIGILEIILAGLIVAYFIFRARQRRRQGGQENFVHQVQQETNASAAKGSTVQDNRIVAIIMATIMAASGSDTPPRIVRISEGNSTGLHTPIWGWAERLGNGGWSK